MSIYPSLLPSGEPPGPRPGTRAYDEKRALSAFPEDAEEEFRLKLSESGGSGRRRRTAEAIKDGALWFSNPNRVASTKKDQSERHWWKTTFRYCPIEQCLFALPTRKHVRERKVVAEEAYFKTIVYEHDIHGPRGHQATATSILCRYYGPTRFESLALLKLCLTCGKQGDNPLNESVNIAPTGSSALQQLSQGHLSIPGVPTFPSFEEKRQWQLVHMAAAFRYFSRQGYTEGMSGNISVRDPEHSNAFWINPMGVHFGLLKASDMTCINMETGDIVGGNQSRPANASGYIIHKAIYLARGDIHAISHARTVHGRAYSAFARPLEMINQDVCHFYNAHSVYSNYGGAVLSDEEGRNISSALGRGKACILTNHGLLTVGSTVDEAAYLLGVLDRSCQAQLLADAASVNHKDKRIIGDNEASYNYKISCDPENLYAEFQPEFDLELSVSNGELQA